MNLIKNLDTVRSRVSLHPTGLRVTRRQHGNALTAGFTVFILSSMSALSSVFAVSAMPVCLLCLLYPLSAVSSVFCMSVCPGHSGHSRHAGQALDFNNHPVYWGSRELHCRPAEAVVRIWFLTALWKKKCSL